MSVLRSTRVALKAAGLSSTSGPDAGSVAVLLRLAAAIDNMAAVETALLSLADDGERMRRPSLDNVTIPTYLRYAEALGLTPAARAAKNGAASDESQGGGTGGRKPGGGLSAVLTFAGQATGQVAGLDRAKDLDEAAS